ncbi:hypothetical protein [Microbacterium gubbeenense]|uniref:hypothetical protein n=1 Tax=Microbacterium gubbeenense TaxID=159896 RepID=UPI000420B2BC|nr:hypothetical protein [Microbacterium gubbeenense]
MTMQRITCTGGPLHGKRYDVHANTKEFPAKGGTYTVKGARATWTAADSETDLGDALEGLADTPARRGTKTSRAKK